MSDKQRIVEIINQCCLMRNGSKPTEFEISIWFDCIQGHTLYDIENAFKNSMKNDTGRLIPAQLKKYLPNISGHPGTEEAFNHLVKTIDHHGYLTDQIRQAWGACSDHLERGDKVAARMAFKEKYEHLVNLGGSAKWSWYQLGSMDFDDQVREKKYLLTRLGEKGWISRQETSKLLEALSQKSGENLISQEKQKENIKAIKNLIQTGLKETSIA